MCCLHPVKVIDHCKVKVKLQEIRLLPIKDNQLNHQTILFEQLPRKPIVGFIDWSINQLTNQSVDPVVHNQNLALPRTTFTSNRPL